MIVLEKYIKLGMWPQYKAK